MRALHYYSSQVSVTCSQSALLCGGEHEVEGVGGQLSESLEVSFPQPVWEWNPTEVLLEHGGHEQWLHRDTR